MLKARMLLSVVAVGVTVPAVAHAQLPQVPEVPQAPQVQVPQVPSVPEVPVPPLPEVPVPDLPEPPAVPAPPAPELPTPSLPAPGGGGGGGAPSGGGGGGTASGGGDSTPSGSGASSPAPSGGGSSSSTSPAVGGGDGTTTRRSRVEASGDEARTPVLRQPAERRLRRAVARLGACLDELARDQARVLVLRTGVGAGAPRTRRGVARVMDIRVSRVRQLERRGLRSARAIARADGCGSAASGGGAIALPSGPPSADGTAGAPAASARSAPDGTGPDHGVATEPAAVRGEMAELAPPDFGSARRGESVAGTSLWVAAGLMLLAAMAGFATPSLRDRLRPQATHE